jgi:polysaccharide pyruvyl transferase WcaK-like protein
MNYRIGISGSYGGMNLGDEAILQGILSKIRTSSINTEIIVFSYNPEDTQKRHNVKALPVREMHKDQVMEELKNLDLFILGGGGLLFNDRVEIFLRECLQIKNQFASLS